MDSKLGVKDRINIKVEVIRDIEIFTPLSMLLVEVPFLQYAEVFIKDALGNKIGLEIDNSFDKVAHTIRSGVVIKMPQYTRVGNGRGKLPWDVDIEVQVGDLVLFSFDSILRIINGHDHLFYYNDKPHVLMPYNDIAMVKRGEELFPVNGYVIIEPVNINTEDKILGYHQKFMTPDAIGKFKSEKIGVVKYISSAVRSYYGVPQDVDGIDIEVGDTVIYRPKTDVPLEDDMHSNFLPVKGLSKVQRRYILLKVVK